MGPLPPTGKRWFIFVRLTAVASDKINTIFFFYLEITSLHGVGTTRIYSVIVVAVIPTADDYT